PCKGGPTPLRGKPPQGGSRPNQPCALLYSPLPLGMRAVSRAGACAWQYAPSPQGPHLMKPSPRLLLTMGDVAGVGPEVIARAWPALVAFCRPVVVGDPAWLRR